METQSEAGGKESRDAEYRRRILEAARKLFDRSGIETVNMYQIAQEAGIGQGTLYRRYNHPGEIYSELLRTSVDRFMDQLEERQNRTAASPALEELYVTIVRVVDYIDENAELLSCINCMYASKQDKHAHMRPVVTRLRDLISALLDRAAAQGETEGVDVEMTVHFFIAVLAPEKYMHYRDHLGYSKERYLAGIRRVFVDGLRRR